MHHDLYRAVHAERERELEPELALRELARTDPDRIVPAGRAARARFATLVAALRTRWAAGLRGARAAQARRTTEPACVCTCGA